MIIGLLKRNDNYNILRFSINFNQ